MTPVFSAVASTWGDQPAVGGGSDKFIACDRGWFTLSKGQAMGLSWQQGPLSPGALGRFLVPELLPKRLLYAEPLRRRMRVRFGGSWIADSEDVFLLFEPGRYPVAYPPDTLQRTGHTTRHRDLGLTSWYIFRAGEQSAQRGAWQHIDRPAYARELQARVAFAWPAMDAFYEDDERIKGHAANSYHRIDIRQASRSLVVRHRDRIVADTRRRVVLYESGFAPRWYVARADVDESALPPVEYRTFGPYKGLCSYYDIGGARWAAWSYREAYPVVSRISDLVSFEPDMVSVQLDGTQLRLEPGQTVIATSPSPRRFLPANSHEGAPDGGLAAAASGPADRPGGKPLPPVTRKETRRLDLSRTSSSGKSRVRSCPGACARR